MGYADGERHEEDRTRKRVGKFDAQVKKGVRDMKVRCYTRTLEHQNTRTCLLPSFTLFKESFLS